MTDEQLDAMLMELGRWRGIGPESQQRLGRVWAEEFHMYAKELIVALRQERQRNSAGGGGEINDYSYT